MFMATKAGLVGAWRIERRMEDRRGPDGAFHGRGVFTPDSDGLLWRETGEMALESGPSFSAFQSHIWRFRAAGEVKVLFADGRPFHEFSAENASGGHECPPDFYRARYAFDPPDAWRLEWRVTGPRKDQRIISEMVRIRA